MVHREELLQKIEGLAVEALASGFTEVAHLLYSLKASIHAGDERNMVFLVHGQYLKPLEERMNLELQYLKSKENRPDRSDG